MWRKTQGAGEQPSAPRIAVIGGGVAGLAAAHRLVELSREAQRPLDVKIFEAGAQLGGTISSERTDGFVIESGPDSFLSEKPWALALCERLGITDRLVGTREEFRRTYVVRGGRLYPLPEGFFLLAPTQVVPVVFSGLFSWPGKVRMALELFVRRGHAGRDESLGSFVRRRFGQEVLDRVAQPLVGGIYTADPERLSLEATMPRFMEMERRHRSIILAMREQLGKRAKGPGSAGSGARWGLFVSFDRGMQSLIEALAERLPEGTVHVRTPIQSLEMASGNGWVLNGNLSCDGVILAVPAHASARLLGGLHAGLGERLASIPYASSATVTMAYRRESIPRPLDAFGFVVPRVENRRIVACTLSSLKYPGRAPAEYVLTRAFVGGALQPELFEQDDAAMVASVRAELADLLGVVGDPVLTRIHRHPNAMPQYYVGHMERLEEIEGLMAQFPRLLLAGSAYRGVGIPDCIHSGETAAETLVKDLLNRVPAAA